MSQRSFGRELLAAAAVLIGSLVVVNAAHATPPPPAAAPQGLEVPGAGVEPEYPAGHLTQLREAAIRLPLAAVFGAALALRPRRRGTPPRRTPVVQTQIVLAIVGGVVMLVVGSSLARAFGIVGVASLIRYRTKIDDPKDAVVMLSALAVGLASGAGLYVLSLFSTLFLVATLGVIESFEPQTRIFELSIKLEDQAMEQLRPKIEAVLRRLRAKYELRGVSEQEVSYLVTTPTAMRTDEASKALTALLPEGKGAVEWVEISKTKVG